jgi:hypothetical protein
MLFINECYHVITLMFLLSHFTLKICLRNFRNNVRGITRLCDTSITDLKLWSWTLGTLIFVSSTPHNFRSYGLG